jgi:hypothetical protein
MSLFINAIEAMRDVGEKERELLIRALSGWSESVSTHGGFPNSCKSDSVFATTSGEGDHGKRLFDGLENSRGSLGRGR